MNIVLRPFVLLCAIVWGITLPACGQIRHAENKTIRTGAERTEIYHSILEGKRIALVVNHTAVVRNTQGELIPLPDTLRQRGLDICCIMAPEHGYRGTADAGAKVADSKDPRLGIPIYSLYGSTKKPLPQWLEEVETVVFDMQDVGTRFYTYMSTMFYVLQACGEQQKEVVILDRPNPNDTIDGPMLDMKFQSFVGMVPIPLLHGCTLGELAQMMVGEGWTGADTPRLTVIPCEGWQHGDPYSLPVAPSPNLPNDHAIALYPSLCLFEGSAVSVGRGTDFPFETYGHPDMSGSFSFTPQANASNKHPLHQGKICRGQDLRLLNAPRGFSLTYVLTAYRELGERFAFIKSHFDRLAGSDRLRTQITNGMTEETIRETWQEDLNKYRQMRTKYLLY